MELVKDHVIISRVELICLQAIFCATFKGALPKRRCPPEARQCPPKDCQNRSSQIDQRIRSSQIGQRIQCGPKEAASQNAELKARGSKCADPSGRLATKIMSFEKKTSKKKKALCQNRSSSASHLCQKQCVGYGRTKGNARVAEHVE